MPVRDNSPFLGGRMIFNKRILKTSVLAAAVMVVFAIFAFRAPEWTGKVSSEFLVYGQTSTGGGTTGGGGGGTGGSAATKVVAQIAAGAYDSASHFGTIIEIVNPNTSAITVSGTFYSENGSPSTLTYATNLGSLPTFTGSFSNVSLPAASILVLSTGTTVASSPSVGTSNWGKITASNTISVASFFEWRRRGDEALYSRVGIPAISYRRRPSAGNTTTFCLPQTNPRSRPPRSLGKVE